MRTSLLLLLLAFVCAAPLSAQSVATPVPTDLTVEERRAYNDALADARKLMAEKQWARASARLDALIKERPREAQARFLRGIVQTEQGQSDSAIATFRALTEDYPELPEPYNNLAVLFARQGEIDSARTALETAIKTAPNWATAHENLGDVYSRLALQQYDRAATLDTANKAAAAKLRLARELLAGAPAQ
ncbi:MAG: tetratricopeptide repeat protein [Pseudomonadota bacterium]|nr:tetratricopeptide repeat protein [Pseudomonadota bacterium]